MIWTAWRGASYGFTVDPKDFDPKWTTVIVELPTPARGHIVVAPNLDKRSFLGKCPHLIDKRIGEWMHAEGYKALWRKFNPPKFLVELVGDRRFRVVGLAAAMQANHKRLPRRQ